MKLESFILFQRKEKEREKKDISLLPARERLRKPKKKKHSLIDDRVIIESSPSILINHKMKILVSRENQKSDRESKRARESERMNNNNGSTNVSSPMAHHRSSVVR